MSHITTTSNKPAVKIGSAIIDKDFYIKIADESVYHFLGKFSIFPITRSIHNDDINRFIEKIYSLPYDKREFIILRLRNTLVEPENTDENNYITTVVFLKKQYANANQVELISIEIYDIFYLHSLIKSLSDAEKRYQALLSLTENTFFEYNTETEYIKIFNYKNSKEIIKDNLPFNQWKENMLKSNLIAKDSINNFKKLCYDIEKSTSSFFHIVENCIYTADGKMETNQIKGVAVNNKSSRFVMGAVISSDSCLTSDLEFLAKKADIDSLTGLLNKKATTEYITEKINSKSVDSLTLVMMDIDYFKDINDNYGHMFGDEVLVNVANVLTNVISSRGIVGRIGGDEFLIALENISEESEIRPILKSIRSQIEWAYSGQIKLSTSLGSASYPKDAENYSELLKLADKCLYIAKEKGRNRFIIYKKEIHGTLSSVELNSNVVSMKPKLSVTQKSSHICNIIEVLSIKKKNGIKEIMDSLFAFYTFDKCMILFGKDLDAFYTSNITDDDLEIKNIIYKYKHIFNENNILSAGSYLHIETKSKELFDFLSKTKNYSTLQYLICNSRKEINGLIYISTHDRTNKWSEVDINYLTIIFKLIAKALFEQ